MDFSDEQLLATFGIALGHIAKNHVTYLNTIDLIDDVGRFLPTIARDAAKSTLLDWLITMEYTADRAGAIAAGSVRAVIEHHLWTSGYETVDQCVGHDLDTTIAMPHELGNLDRAAKIVLINTLRSFPLPFVVPRIRALVEWCTSEECRRDFPNLYCDDPDIFAVNRAVNRADNRAVNRSSIAVDKTFRAEPIAQPIDDKPIDDQPIDDQPIDERQSQALHIGARVDLTKNRLENVALVVRWRDEHPDAAIDHSAFLLGADGKVHSDADFIYYANPMHASECVEYIPLRRNAARINVALSKIPDAIDKISFNLTIEGTGDYHAAFGRIEGLSMRLIDATTNVEVARFDFDGLSNETALVVGEIYRHKGAWKFKIVGAGYYGGVEVLCQNAGVSFQPAE